MRSLGASSRSASPVERAALVGLCTRPGGRDAAERSLRELGGLALSAGATVVFRVIQERPVPDPATFLGRGRIEMLAKSCRAADVDLVVFDNELSPAQARNIERIVGVKVLDRTQLILDIFARRARTREGQLQVELAQLRYLLPRLVGTGTALSRLGAGIGTRGPGETKLEADRRRIRHRISGLKGQIETVRRRRAQLRDRRHKRELPTVALVGYTNAGKTTLFNLLTGDAARASDALFVTLDPLVRRVRPRGGGEFLLSDTVGFIDRLPHTLVAAFRATLEEVVDAVLLVHVIDASSPERESQREAVYRVLTEVGADRVPRVDVFNKIDLLTPAERSRCAERYPDAICVSATTGAGREDLVAEVVRRVARDLRRVTLEFDAASADDSARIARLYRDARVVRQTTRQGRIRIEADVPERALARVGGSGARATGRRPATGV